MSRQRKSISGSNAKKRNPTTSKHTQVETHTGRESWRTKGKSTLWVQRADFNGPSSLSVFTSLSLQSISPLSSRKCRSHLFFTLSTIQHLLTGLSSPPSHPLPLSKSVSISFCLSSPLSFPHFKLIFHCTNVTKPHPSLFYFSPSLSHKVHSVVSLPRWLHSHILNWTADDSYSLNFTAPLSLHDGTHNCNATDITDFTPLKSYYAVFWWPNH